MLMPQVQPRVTLNTFSSPTKSRPENDKAPHHEDVQPLLISPEFFGSQLIAGEPHSSPVRNLGASLGVSMSPNRVSQLQREVLAAAALPPLLSPFGEQNQAVFPMPPLRLLTSPDVVLRVEASRDRVWKQGKQLVAARSGSSATTAQHHLFFVGHLEKRVTELLFF